MRRRKKRRARTRTSARDCVCAAVISFARAAAEWQARVTSSEPGFVSWLKNVWPCASLLPPVERQDETKALISRQSSREKRRRFNFLAHVFFFFFCASPRTRDLRCQPLNCLHLDAGLAPRLAGSCRLELLPSGNLQAIALHLRELCSSSALALALAHPVRRRHVFSSPLKQTAEALY